MNCKECSKKIKFWQARILEQSGETGYHYKCYKKIVADITGGERDNE